MKRSKIKKRQVRRRILILCEGETERNYFQAIKEDPDFKQILSAIYPQVVAAKHPTPKQVVKEAKERLKKEADQGNPYDKVWVVFDHDNHPNRTEAYTIAKKESFGIAFTAIAFEMWFLLHFKRTAKGFTNDKKLRTTLQDHYPNYEKAKQNDFAKLKPHLSEAFKNAVWLRSEKFDEKKAITDHNPWTDVDVLVEELIEADK
ncbi:MAG: hypothetical protein DHS20C18_46490 [Saprospiraceae bacterium]|nr:MAG: hypothetical protein DHS20C18_46490 [Saprospiraceae bacterium]